VYVCKYHKWFVQALWDLSHLEELLH
jgi:hypothetical protein